jgi:outer membrane protein OmpA-like peptidoglycan-associated protein
MGEKKALKKPYWLRKIAVFTLFILLARAEAVFGGVTPAGTLFMPLLQQGGTARAIAMGLSYVSVARGTDSLLWNPAGLAGIQFADLSLHHTAGLGNLVQEQMILGVNAGWFGGLAFSFYMTDNGMFELRDAFGALTGTQNAGGYGVSMGWGRVFLPGLMAGLSLKTGRQNIANSEFNFFAADAGIIWQVNDAFCAGISYTNFGGPSGRVYMAPGLRLGASYMLNLGEGASLLAAVSTELQPGGIARVSVGAEATLSGFLRIRAGAIRSINAESAQGITGLSAGLGFRINDVVLDYACVPSGDLGITNRISLTYSFSRPAAETKTARAVVYIKKPEELKGAEFSDAMFEFDSAIINDAAAEAIRKNVEMLRKYPGVNLLIEGHTCKVGTEEYNTGLSWRRARAVREYILKVFGDIKEKRLSVIGYGAARPLTYEYDPENFESDAAKLNRRAVFSIIVR